MAQYITTDYITEQFPDYSFGTSGTDFMGIGEGTRIIERVSKFIDFKLQGIYGTYNPIFGTNNLGTSLVPQEIQDCACDIFMGVAMENRTLSITPIQHDWGTTIYQRGMEYLEMLSNGVGIVEPFNGTVSSGNTVPSSSGNYVNVYGEEVTIDGTNFIKLDYRTVIKGGVSVYTGTDTGTTEYAQGTDYEILYFHDRLVGTNFGMIRGLGVGIADGETVRIDYRYKPGRIFYNDQYRLWGENNPEVRT